MVSQDAKSSGSGSNSKNRVIIFAESGLLAGDLAAWLSGRFIVERVTSIPGALVALGQPASAVIIVEGASLKKTAPLDQMVQEAKRSASRVLVLGWSPGQSSNSWSPEVIHLPAVPDPGDLFKALTAEPPLAGMAQA